MLTRLMGTMSSLYIHIKRFLRRLWRSARQEDAGQRLISHTGTSGLGAGSFLLKLPGSYLSTLPSAEALVADSSLS